jgi:hypothetical protein
LEDDQMTTRVIDTDEREEERGEREDDERWIDPESEAGGRGGWDDDGDDEVIPPRPRGRLLRPLPLALIALIIAAAGFLGGIEAQKGSESGPGGAAGPGGGGLPNFAALKESAGATTGGASASASTNGTVTSVEGHTIYVKESDGTTVAVTVGDGATVTRDSNVATKKIHPGDTVVVQGSKKGSTVTASSIAASESGVESTAVGAPTETTESETSVKSLFEE